MLDIYYVEAVANVVIAEGEDQYGYCCETMEDTVGHLVCAKSRGMARLWMVKEYWLDDFTYPMSIRKVKHSLPQDELSEGEFRGDGFVDDNLVLRDASELDDYIEQKMLAS